MFDHRPSRIMLREKFQKHKWEKDESFMHHYLHFMQKIILGNRLPVVEEELIEYIIDGIPVLRNEARVSSFGIRTSFMALFEQVEPDKKEETKNGEEKYQLRSRRDRGGEGGMNKPRRDKGSEGGTSRGRGTASIADCPIMLVEIVQRRCNEDQNVFSVMSVNTLSQNALSKREP